MVFFRLFARFALSFTLLFVAFFLCVRGRFFFHGFYSFVWPVVLYCLVRIFHGTNRVWFVLELPVDMQVNKSMMNFSSRKRGGFKYHACSNTHLFCAPFELHAQHIWPSVC